MVQSCINMLNLKVQSQNMNQVKVNIFGYNPFIIYPMQNSLCYEKGDNFSLPPQKLKFGKHLLPFELVRRDVFHKNDRKESQLYLKELTLWYIRLNIYVWKTKFSSHKQYLFDLLFSRNAKKTHIDQSILHSFLLCLKINVSQTFRSSSCRNVFCKCACQ